MKEIGTVAAARSTKHLRAEVNPSDWIWGIDPTGTVCWMNPGPCSWVGG
jgi:hypothetical protein